MLIIYKSLFVVLLLKLFAWNAINAKKASNDSELDEMKSDMPGDDLLKYVTALESITDLSKEYINDTQFDAQYLMSIFFVNGKCLPTYLPTQLISREKK